MEEEAANELLDELLPENTPPLPSNTAAPPESVDVLLALPGKQTLLRGTASRKRRLACTAHLTCTDLRPTTASQRQLIGEECDSRRRSKGLPDSDKNNSEGGTGSVHRALASSASFSILHLVNIYSLAFCLLANLTFSFI